MSARKIAAAFAAVGIALVAVGLTCFGFAIWVVGPDSGRLGGTGFLLLIVGTGMALGAFAYLDTSRP